ncbi:MAG: DUF938 domain-containing protein [Pseudorhodoplanes sp.]|nr:hypothetical protein [Pseudorhodoplanes sp.]MBW7950143.1 DUF938 domain-containing protein [Pseudorhodoplanes sp.]GIK79391.1 MAG: hypothetical protein BroJett024_04960 [Alphaproteobacteria bacterium]
MPPIFDPRIEAEGRLDAPAFHRNHEPIWAVLAPYLADARGHVLEAGSGTGQHVVTFAKKSPQLVWWPSDYEARHLRSIEAWRAQAGCDNVRPARFIDLAAPGWGLGDADTDELHDLTAIFCANVIHISPWPVAEGLFAQAYGRLRPDGRLFLYGPFKRDGEHTAPSNTAFDASLRAQDPQWGIRDLADVAALAKASGLALEKTEPMPANNLTLVFVRHGEAGRRVTAPR